VVRATGGIVDTVHDGDTGFTFDAFTADACWGALQRALGAYRGDPHAWRRMQRAGIAADFSWPMSARGYQQIYEWAIARTGG
jgi:starch synthase